LGLVGALAGGVCALLLIGGFSHAAAVLSTACVSLIGAVLIRDGVGRAKVAPPHDSVSPHDARGALWSREAIRDSSALRESLERLITRAWSHSQAQGIELECIDVHHEGARTAVSIGGPVTDGTKGQVHREDLIFAGQVVGKLSVKFAADCEAGEDRIGRLREVAHECAMSIVNARFTQATLPKQQESEQQVRVRSAFLANLSHELRSPIGIVLNASELLLEGVCGAVTADQEETLTMVKLNAEHLMELITDVLDYSRVEAGTLTPHPEVLSLAAQVGEVSNMVGSQAAKKHQYIRCRPSSEEFAVRFDRRHLRQSLLNVLTNAIKYTPEGGTVEVWIERVANSMFRICVRDSGIGIGQQDRGRVFAAFERLDHPYARAQMGTGLGLSLTRKLIELNGATIDFHSELGFGSTFWIDVPREESVAPVLSQREDLSVPLASGERILMVSPEDEERVLVARYLRSVGYDILFASTESEARQYLRSGGVSLVLLTDRFVPTSGGRFASFVRDEERDRHIPVLLLTRRAFLADVEHYLREDVDRCLAKPVRLSELALACRTSLDYTGRGL
jgi:signal transduction histidine kinase/CheY-like chemotaxis protein